MRSLYDELILARDDDLCVPCSGLNRADIHSTNSALYMYGLKMVKQWYRSLYFEYKINYIYNTGLSHDAEIL